MPKDVTQAYKVRRARARNQFERAKRQALLDTLRDYRAMQQLVRDEQDQRPRMH